LSPKRDSVLDGSASSGTHRLLSQNLGNLGAPRKKDLEDNALYQGPITRGCDRRKHISTVKDWIPGVEALNQLCSVENHAPNVGGQVRGGGGYKRVGDNFKNSYHIYQKRSK